MVGVFRRFFGSACRPGSVTPRTLTCYYSPGMPPELLVYLSWVLISSGVFSPSGGKETELAKVLPLDHHSVGHPGDELRDALC